MANDRPTLLQYVAYSYGRRLPDSMRSWVSHDLAGEGAVRRHVIRAAIPPLLVLAPFWLLPASPYVHLEMTAPIWIWALLMSVALNKVWRRYRAAQHNLDPNLVDAINRKKGRAPPRGLPSALRTAPGFRESTVEQQPVLAPDSPDGRRRAGRDASIRLHVSRTGDPMRRNPQIEWVVLGGVAACLLLAVASPA